MKKLLAILVLGLLLISSNAYAFLVKTGKESLPIITVPPGAQCELKNNKGTWSVVTPGEVRVKRSKQPLKITCVKDGYKKITKSYHLKDPKEKLLSRDMTDEYSITTLAGGDPSGIILDAASLALDAVMKFGTYATHKKGDKAYIFIQLIKKE